MDNYTAGKERRRVIGIEYRGNWYRLTHTAPDGTDPATWEYETETEIRPELDEETLGALLRLGSKVLGIELYADGELP